MTPALAMLPRPQTIALPGTYTTFRKPAPTRSESATSASTGAVEGSAACTIATRDSSGPVSAITATSSAHSPFVATRMMCLLLCRRVFPATFTTTRSSTCTPLRYPN